MSNELEKLRKRVHLLEELLKEKDRQLQSYKTSTKSLLAGADKSKSEYLEEKKRKEEYAALNEEFTATNEALKKQIYEYEKLTKEYQDVNKNLKKTNNKLLRAKKEISESENKYKTIAENTSDGLVVFNKNFIITYASPAYFQLFKFTPKEVIGINDKTIYQRIHPEDREQLFDKLFDALKSKKAGLTYQYRFKLKSENYIWREDSAKFFYDDQGKHINSYVVCRDITERMKTAISLEQSEFRFKKMFENMPSGVAVYKPVKDGKDFEFIEINKSAERITRTLNKSIIGKTLLEEFPNMDKSPLYKAFREVHQTGKDIHLEPFFYKDEKREGWRENYIYKLPSGEIVAIFGDVTDKMNFREKLLKQNEDLEIARDKAEESNRLKMAFLNNISHEFRTPMNGILGFVNLISKPEIESKQRLVYSEQITQCSERLLDIVTDIVEIAQVQSNSSVLNLTDANLKDLIHTSIKDVQSKIGTKNIMFSASVPDMLDITVHADAFKIIRSLKHLLENAIKFTSEGSIEFITRLTEGNHLHVEVKDTGIGIPAKLQNIVFEPFRQVETLMTRNYGGNGVGLPLVKAYIKMLGGTIWLQSEEGVGTVVKLDIPLSPSEPVKQNETFNLADNPEKTGKTILIVDDEPTNCIYLKEVLNDLDVHTLTVGNGKEAVDMCKDNPNIHLVLMDIKMPVMDGYEATKLIKKDHPDIIVIAQTAFTSGSDIRRIKSSGFDNYLAKPMRQEELLRIINMYIKG